ncbi:MAG: enoyl-CoA hydratase-related protein [Chloroflexi bacterium]|nr:enoyl-CoA hydratase-related protein [Chloroflexota bacterium]MDA1146326.1 enoyl-CoA hydratase-related protein [Chloroflexota bacterium]
MTTETAPTRASTTAVDTGTDQLLAERDGQVLILTFNRPDRMNAISTEMLGALSRMLTQANRDPEVRALIITGTGRGFCAGLDLVDSGPGAREAAGKQVQQLFDLHDSPPTVLWNMDKPVICALNGAAAGYGMDLALLCDIRISGESGRMAAVTAKRNLLPESGGTWLLPRLIGWGKSAELFFRGRVVGAAECKELGIVNEVVPDEDLMATARQWAQEIATNAPMAVQATKRMMRQGMNETYETTVDHLLVHLRVLFGMEDFKEGVASFMERRDPEFTGR